MSMEVRKENAALEGGAAERDMAEINRFAKRTLTADEVYTFAVRLCDNEVDRDGERFPRATLEELKRLFAGKSGIFDHEWSAKGQAARIYRTEIVEEEGVSATGERRCYLKGYAYMMRGGENETLIREIEGGIKKEVSVGCSVKRCACSICGQEMGSCAHEKGKTYGGKLCCGELLEAADAYEWSFVAVPAQPRAGVLKRHGGGTDGTLGTLVKQYGSPAQARELETLEQQAGQGRRYLEALRGEVKRLMLTAEQETDGAVIEAMTGKLGEEELCALERIYRKRALKRLGLRTQLVYGETKTAAEDENDFCV